MRKKDKNIDFGANRREYWPAWQRVTADFENYKKFVERKPRALASDGQG